MYIKTYTNYFKSNVNDLLNNFDSNNNILIVYNGIDYREDDKNIKRHSIIDELIKLKYNVYFLDLKDSMNNISLISQHMISIKPLCVFNFVDTFSDNSKYASILPMYFEYNKIPFTGCGSDFFSLSVNKILWKQVFQSCNILTPEFYTIDKINDVNKSKKYIVKTTFGCASMNITSKSIFDNSNVDDIKETIKRKKYKVDEWYIEEFISGREFRGCAYGNSDEYTILHPLEMGNDKKEMKDGILDYKSKYGKSKDNFDTINLDDPKSKEIQKEISNIMKNICEKFNIDGYISCDFRVSEDNKIYCVDLNANPSIEANTRFAESLAYNDLTMRDVLTTMIKNAIKRNK